MDDPKLFELWQNICNEIHGTLVANDSLPIVLLPFVSLSETGTSAATVSNSNLRSQTERHEDRTMGRKKKRRNPNPRDRIFCYYCDRTFNTEQELLMHQREKHLRCPTCNKRMLSVPSLTIHSEQMHNTVVPSVPNAIPGRTSTQVDVLGMKGVPEEYYQALEGKSKKANYDNEGYHPYPPAQPYSNHQTYPPSAYPQQGYNNHPYAQGYQQQYPQHYPQSYSYATQGYSTQNYPSQGYTYPPQQRYATAPYGTHPTSYSQKQYGPQQPPPQTQPQATQQYSTHHSTYSQSASTAPMQSQTNGPCPVPDDQPPSIPASAKEAPSTQTRTTDGPSTTTTNAAGKPVIQSEPGVTVVFDRTDVSMEELRARLPRYRITASES